MKPLSQILASLREKSVVQSKVSETTPIHRIALRAQDVLPGDCYIAIRGTRSDGHEYVAQALEKGAACALVENPEVFHASAQAVLVENTRLALGLVASDWFDHPSAKLTTVAVTGTNGKTTSTYLINDLWKALGFQTGLVGTVSYRIGDREIPAPLTTPDALTLQKMLSEMVSAGCSHLCMEASSIALDQHRLSGTQIDVAAFTNLTQDHLDYHGSMEAYYQSKLRLFTDLKPRHSVLNIDDDWGKRLAEGIDSPTTYSLSQPATVRVHSWSVDSEGTRLEVEISGRRWTATTRLLGRHNVANIACVLGVATALGLDMESVMGILPTLRGAPGRFEVVPLPPGSPEVIVDYAHTPDALLNLLKLGQERKALRGGKLITVFGCGGDRDRGKRPQMGKIASEMSDLVVVTSDNPRTERPEVIVEEIRAGIPRTDGITEVDRRRAIHHAIGLADSRDTILIAGKGHETYQEIGIERVPFDDRVVAQDYFKSGRLDSQIPALLP